MTIFKHKKSEFKDMRISIPFDRLLTTEKFAMKLNDFNLNGAKVPVKVDQFNDDENTIRLYCGGEFIGMLPKSWLVEL